jgi:hypothetical protein
MDSSSFLWGNLVLRVVVDSRGGQMINRDSWRVERMILGLN